MYCFLKVYYASSVDSAPPSQVNMIVVSEKGRILLDHFNYAEKHTVHDAHPWSWQKSISVNIGKYIVTNFFCHIAQL